jgi:hypothetical protein
LFLWFNLVQHCNMLITLDLDECQHLFMLSIWLPWFSLLHFHWCIWTCLLISFVFCLCWISFFNIIDKYNIYIKLKNSNSNAFDFVFYLCISK